MLLHIGTSLITHKILIYGRTAKKANNVFAQSEYFTVAAMCFQGAAVRKLPGLSSAALSLVGGR